MVGFRGMIEFSQSSYLEATRQLSGNWLLRKTMDFLGDNLDYGQLKR